MKTNRMFSVVLITVLLAVLAVPSVFAAPPGPDIVETAIAANALGGPFEGVFDTLIAAVLSADPAVANTLGGNGQFTVFAPTDFAFDKLGLTADNIADCLSTEDLTNILLYHVARGNRDSGEVTSSTQIRTLLGERFKVNGTTLTDNLGRPVIIIVPDVDLPSNGVIHAVDDVLLPYLPDLTC